MKLTIPFLLFACSFSLAQNKSKYHELDSLSKLYEKSDLERSYDYQQQALTQATLLNDAQALMDANARIARILYLQGNFQASLNHWDTTYRYALNTYDTLVIYKGIGIAHDRMGNPDLALDYLLKALELAQGYEVDLRIDILNDIGLLYRRIDEPEKALRYFHITNRLKAEDPHYTKAYMNMGVIYLDLDTYDSAIHYFNLGYERMNKNDLRSISIYYNNMGATLSDMGKPEEAIPYAEKAIEAKKKLGNVSSLANSYNLLSGVYLNLKDYPAAEKYASLSLATQDSSSINNIRYNALRYLIEARIKQKDTTQIIDLVYQTMDVRNVTYSQEKTEAFSEMAAKYDLKEKENELLQKNLDLQKAQNEIDQQAIIRKALLGGLFLSLIIIALIYFSQRRKARDNRLLTLKNEEIEKRNEQIRQMEQYKSRFFANISHEFRTPLTLILGPIEEVRSKVADRQANLYLDMIQQNARRLLTQINQLLDLSKLDSGELKLQVIERDIVSFMRGITMCFESLAATRGINLTFYSNEAVIKTWFDKDCLEKIMVNLLSNGFKFTTDSDDISVSVIRKDNMVDISVADTGRGIETNQLEQVFERYYHTESDVQASSGIGLALVKELVEAHSGSVNLKSMKGEGSTFTISLPLLDKDQWREMDVNILETQSDELDKLPAPELMLDHGFEKEEPMTISDNKKCVLVIEDNADVRLFIKEALKDTFDIVEAQNGEAGIELGEELLPDVIISDIMMYGIDGYEVVKHLKQSEKSSHIPIILLTARADVESKLKGLEIEADDFITKPFERKELVARITNLINTREKLKTQFSNTVVLKPGDITISSIDQAFVEKLLASVEENIDNSNFGVEDLARAVGMSRSQLHRKLQAIAGQPPNKFIRNIRLARAMELLKSNAGAVSEIAYMTGFNTPNYFSKCFHDQFGVAPGEVKKEVI